MSKEFYQVVWNEQLRDDWAALLRLAIAEDLAESGDWTTLALVPENAVGHAAVVAREQGIIAGLSGVEAALHAVEPRSQWSADLEDGRPVRPGDRVGTIDGPARGLLTAERLVLNLLGHLSGIATLTRQYVEAVAGTRAVIYDTRKTTPGWRRLEKYAVRCGGGRNHRSGLFEAILIKDNHLAWGAGAAQPRDDRLPRDAVGRYTPAEAVARARRFIEQRAGSGEMIVEIEVDTLAQLDEVLPAGADIVLLDNMTPEQLRRAVARRDACDTTVELEASGGVNLATVRSIAESGVDRISVGALTHSAVCLDLGLDWIGTV